jgi:hypothetical protein
MTMSQPKVAKRVQESPPKIKRPMSTTGVFAFCRFKWLRLLPVRSEEPDEAKARKGYRAQRSALPKLSQSRALVYASPLDKAFPPSDGNFPLLMTRPSFCESRDTGRMRSGQSALTWMPFLHQQCPVATHIL